MAKQPHPYQQSIRTRMPPAGAPLRRARDASQRSRTMRGRERPRAEFVPPEDWYEPSSFRSPDYRIIVRDPGAGYRHAVSERDIRQRLAGLPADMLAPLQVVQLSRMTHKKRTFPCYGMQWGASLYLYPVEENLIEYFARPPLPAERQEVAMFGGKWSYVDGLWQLIWTEQSIRDFYLDNVLLHELGHLLDERNSRHEDRERFAEWFALKYGYVGSQRKVRRRCRRVKRRHGPRR